MNLARPTSVKPLAATAALLLLVGLALPACAGEGKSQPAKVAPAAAGPQIVAEIDGQPVPMSDLEQLVAPQLAQLDKQRRQILEQSLEGLVEEKMVEREAAARGVTKDQLLASEVGSKVTEVTDAEVDAWYEQNKARIGNRPKDDDRRSDQGLSRQRARPEVRRTTSSPPCAASTRSSCCSSRTASRSPVGAAARDRPRRPSPSSSSPTSSARSARASIRRSSRSAAPMATRSGSSSATSRCRSTPTRRRPPRRSSAPASRASSGRCTTQCSPTRRA